MCPWNLLPCSGSAFETAVSSHGLPRRWARRPRSPSIGRPSCRPPGEPDVLSWLAPRPPPGGRGPGVGEKGRSERDAQGTLLARRILDLHLERAAGVGDHPAQVAEVLDPVSVRRADDVADLQPGPLR